MNTHNTHLISPAESIILLVEIVLILDSQEARSRFAKQPVERIMQVQCGEICGTISGLTHGYGY
jgi:hypothetical protein